MRAPILDWPGKSADGPASLTSRGQRAAAPARALFSLQVLLLIVMAGTVATKTWQDHVWIGFVIVGATLLCWLPELAKPRARRWWFAYVAGIFFYTLLRSYADDTVVPTRTMYAIDADRLIFLGTEPVVWLQEHLFSPTRLSPLDFFAVQVHWSFFIAPHLAAVLVFVWRRELFPRYTVLVVGTMYIGLLLFFVLPTAPPWLAARAGALPEAFRVMDFVGGRVDATTYRTFYQSLGEPNSVAAMPSIHMAVTFAMFLWTRDHHPRWAPFLAAYALVMAFSLIYLAEHYAIDLLAGVGVAVLCHLASKRLVPVPVEP